jgi:hypothetical protein
MERVDLLPLLSVSAVVSGIGAAILLLALGTHLSGRALLRGYAELASAVAVPSVVVGLVALVAVIDLSDLAPRIAALAAACCGLLILAATYLKFRPMSVVRSSLIGLREPSRQKRALVRLLAGLERIRPKLADDRPYRGTYPDVVLAASAQLVAHGLFRPAERICAALPEAWLSQKQSIERATNLALCRLRRGDVPGAQSAIEGARGGIDRRGAEMLLASKAMLALADGRPRDALTILRQASSLPSGALVVRAHAHAAVGEVQAARTVVRELESREGVEALDAIIYPFGPATPIAIDEKRAARDRQPLR